MQKRYIFPILALCLLFVSPASPAIAAHDGGHGAAHGGTSPAPAKAPSGMIYTAKGKIMQVDKDANRITIDHEPVPALKWPQMIMPFRVEDSSLLDGLKKGGSVRLDFRPDGSGREPVIVDIEVLK